MYDSCCRLQISLSDFDIIRRLGDGSFSTVVLAKYKADGRMYAVKIVNKSLILRNKVGTAKSRQHINLLWCIVSSLSVSIPVVGLESAACAPQYPLPFCVRRWQITFGTKGVYWTSCSTLVLHSFSSHSRCDNRNSCAAGRCLLMYDQLTLLLYSCSRQLPPTHAVK